MSRPLQPGNNTSQPAFAQLNDPLPPPPLPLISGANSLARQQERERQRQGYRNRQNDSDKATEIARTTASPFSNTRGTVRTGFLPTFVLALRHQAQRLSKPLERSLESLSTTTFPCPQSRKTKVLFVSLLLLIKPPSLAALVKLLRVFTSPAK
jgi:hypothetical protein